MNLFGVTFLLSVSYLSFPLLSRSHNSLPMYRRVGRGGEETVHRLLVDAGNPFFFTEFEPS